MNRETAWMLAIWLPIAAAALAPPRAGAEVPAERILGELPDEIGIEERRAAEVVISGDLAAARLASAIYLLERDAGGHWRPVTRITAPGEAHFGDSMLLTSDTLLVAAPDTAGAGLGPGMAYVFQRHVGGSDHWGLVARLTPAAYPPPGSVEVRQLAPAAEAPTAAEVPAAEVPAAKTEPPPEPTVSEAEPPPEETVVEAPPVEEAVAEPPVEEAAAEPLIEEAVDEAPPPTEAEPDDDQPAVEETVAEAPTAAEAPAAEAPAAEAPAAEAPAAEAPAAETEPADPTDLRYIVIANMREKPRALKLAASLRDQGYASEVHRNGRGFFIVTLARLPRAEARRVRAEAVAAGDIPPDSYLITGSAFRERVSP